MRPIGVRVQFLDWDDASRDDDKVCVVGASTAWPFYRMNGAYVCQENRYIQEDTGRIGFYTARLIHGAAPRIQQIYPSVPYDDATAAKFIFHTHPLLRRIGQVLAAALEEGHADQSVQIVLLSPIGDPDTAAFEPVRHDDKGAWTQRQRYVSLEQLRAASTTNDLATYETAL